MTLVIGLLVLGTINLFPVIKRHAGTIHPLDSTEVTVYPPDYSGIPPVLPTVEISNQNPGVAKNNVMVFIHYSYDDNLAKPIPKLSLIIVLITLAAYFVEIAVFRNKQRAA